MHRSCLFLAFVVLVIAGPAQEPRVRVNLDDYVGQFQSEGKAVLVVRRTRAHLTAQLTGQFRAELEPRSEKLFRWKTPIESTLTVQKDEQGKVTGWVQDQGGRAVVYRKVTSELPPDPEFTEAPEKIASPRLAALAKAVQAGEPGAVDAFWKELHDKAPLVEAIPGDRLHRRVTFVWRGNERTKRVDLRGGLPSEESPKSLTRLGTTDVWYRSERLPHDARLAYGFMVNRPSRVPDDVMSQVAALVKHPPLPDPLNPKEVSIQGMVGSLLELPDAPPQPWLERMPGVPAGKLTSHTIKSQLLKQERSFTVYTPSYFEEGGVPHGLLILFDGPFYQSRDEIPGPIILDNLIAKKKIPPVVVLFITQKLRNIELSCSESFADFVAKELVPWARQHLNAGLTADQTAVGGLSLGGLMASFCAWRHPDVFGNVLSQSGSYQWYPGMIGVVPSKGEPGWLTRRFVESPRRAVRFYLEAGRFEHDMYNSLLTENQRFRDVLEAKGYDVRYSEFSGGHDFVSWRGSFAEGVMHLFGKAGR